MCNTVYMAGCRLDPKPIPETGTGWKLFLSIDGVLSPAYYSRAGYKLDEEGWAHFDRSMGPGDAFCFFLDHETAKVNLDDLETNYHLGPRERVSLVLLPIEYQGGIQKRIEPGVLGPSGKSAIIGLATSFRVQKS